MSTRQVTTDDHTGAEIMEGIDQTRAQVSVSRNGQTQSWLDVNLTQESWDELVKILTDFFPHTPADEGQADQGQADQGETPEQRDARHQAKAVRDADLAAQLVAERRVTPAASSAPTGRRSDSAEIRAWWYALSAADLKRLGLPTPKNRSTTVGKLPANVYTIYDQAHTA
jgi:hypothetical protein